MAPWLYPLRDGLGLRDNDAFSRIVMALKYYDSFFRRYPAEFAGTPNAAIEDARAAFAAAAGREAAQVQRVPSEKVAETGVAIAPRLADRPVGRHMVTRILAAVVAFGALCISAGYSLAAPLTPFWVPTRDNVSARSA